MTPLRCSVTCIYMRWSSCRRSASSPFTRLSSCPSNSWDLSFNYYSVFDNCISSNTFMACIYWHYTVIAGYRSYSLLLFYRRCLLLFASYCCSKCLSAIRPRLGTKIRPAALKSLLQTILAGNSVQLNKSWLRIWPVIQECQGVRVIP